MTEQMNWGALIEQAGKELEPLPKGTYDVVVEDANDTQTATQKLMYKLKFRVQGGEYANRVLWNNITLTTDNPTALAMFFRNMDAMGLDRQYFSMNPSPSDVASALVGRTVRVVIDHRLYQGSTRENVKQMIKATGVMGIPGMPSSGAPAGIPVPSMQPSAPISAAPIAPPVSAPAPVAPAPVAPAAPVPVAVQPSPEPTPPPTPQVETPVQVQESIPAPPPVPAPAPAPVEAAAPAEDPDMAAFLAFKASQAAAAAPAEAPIQPATPAGPPAPPPVPF